MQNFWLLLKYGNRFCGVEHSTKNGEKIIYASVLKKKNKELTFDLLIEEKSIEGVCNKLQKNQALTLIINDDNILSKTIENQQNTLKLIYEAFPNINIEEFYYEILTQKNTHFISICRKDYVNNLIESYNKKNINIINISLGNALVETVTKLTTKTDFYSSNANIKIDENKIDIILIKGNDISESCEINGLKIDNNFLLSFLGALDILFNATSTKINFKEKKEHQINLFYQKRFFLNFLKIGGSIIFLLLIINFFFFNYYSNGVNELKQSIQAVQTKKSQILELHESVSKKNKMAENLLKTNHSNSSFYCDQIIQNLPESILLSEYIYQPILKKIQAGKTIEIDEKIIIITGEFEDNNTFSNWINELEQIHWISKVLIVDYNSSNLNTSRFKIKISIR